MCTRTDMRMQDIKPPYPAQHVYMRIYIYMYVCLQIYEYIHVCAYT